VLLPVVLVVAVTACSADAGDDELVADGSTLAPVATTAPPPPTTVAPTTAPPTTVVETTVATTTTTTTAPPVTEPPVTVPPAVRELVLRRDGIGTAAFGTDPDAVVGYVSSFLGSPTGDTGWTDPYSFAICPGNEVRRVEWGVFSLLFSDDSPVASARRHFFAWEYGLAGQVGDEPQGLSTPGGVGLGDRVVDLRAEFPGVFVNEGEDDLFPSNFYVDDCRRTGRSAPGSAGSRRRQPVVSTDRIASRSAGVDLEPVGVECRSASRPPRRRRHPLEHPLQHAAVVAEARPQEAAVLVTAEPVDEEDLGQLLGVGRRADLEPVAK
jgi:hypothetical protein